MTDIPASLTMVRDAIAAYAREFSRDPDSVRLVAVSKTRPASDIAIALKSGQLDFGENYLQEATPKLETLAGRGAVWHYIGRIQSNKTRELAARFDWVQTVDRERIAVRLNDHRPAALPPLNICLQVNVDAEPQKAGVLPGQLAALADAVVQMPRLRLRGLMAIPAETADFDSQRRAFAQARELFETLREQHRALDTLSMGMSGDLRAAIAEGSTMVRVGTAVFGPRG
ncbi:MAG TPA: YggS family pyridoxal phosphate-dependent enzyme [Gammaproteobacteria bacterium]